MSCNCINIMHQLSNLQHMANINKKKELYTASSQPNINFVRYKSKEKIYQEILPIHQ